MKRSYRERDHVYGESMLKLRTAIGLTQERLGNLLGISGRTLGGWEAGCVYPKTEHLKKVIALAVQHGAFPPGNTAEEIRALWKVARQKILIDEQWLSALLSEQNRPLPHTAEVSGEETRSLVPVTGRPASLPVEQTLPMIQNLPFPPNPFFTGRESELLLMSQLFEQNARIAITQPISISGLGGIGKTQLALEYAHRCYPSVYRSVLWVNAADKASLEAGYLALAYHLNLLERTEREVERIVQAVKIWLEEHTHWLLILDNADDLELARALLPTRPRGHILLTTRSQIVGDITALIQIEALSRQEGLLFLLKRAGLLPPGTDSSSLTSDIRCEAEALVEVLADHPLALDQAGAYIEETRDPGASASSASFTQYRQIYQQQRHHLLKRRGSLGGQHPASVACTLEIGVQKACEQHPRCADILSFCALLHPDAIPEEMLCEETGLSLLDFNEVIGALRKYSLVKRDLERKILSVHRLVQAVIREGMTLLQFGQWASCVVRALNKAFPEGRFEQWSRCELLLPHVQFCATWIERETPSMPETAHLLQKAGIYLRDRGQYTDAEPLLMRALSMREQYLGTEHPDTATSLHNLGFLYWRQGKYKQAEPLYLRALSIREQSLGTSHPDTALNLNNLGILYWQQGKYEQAEPLYLRALLIYEQCLGTSHPDTAKTLNNLGLLYYQQGNYKQAEPLYQRALVIREQSLGTSHPETAMSLNNLALLYADQDKHEKAEPLYQRALLIYEQCLGTEHPDTARTLNNLAYLYGRQGKYELAESLCQRALIIREQCLLTEHPDIGYSLCVLADLYQQQGKYEQAEPLYQRALLILEQSLGTEHSGTAYPLQGLAELYRQQGKYEQAEALFLRALSIREKCLGETHPDTEASRKAYAAFLCLARGSSDAI